MASAAAEPDDRLALIVRASVMLAHVLDMLDLATIPIERLVASPTPFADVALTPLRARVEVLRQIAEDPSRPEAIPLLLAAIAQAQEAFHLQPQPKSTGGIFAWIKRSLLRNRSSAYTPLPHELWIKRFEQLSVNLANLPQPQPDPPPAQLDPPAPTSEPAAARRSGGPGTGRPQPLVAQQADSSADRRIV